MRAIEIVGICVVTFVAQVSFSVSGFGSSILFQVGYHLLSLVNIVDGDLQSAVTLISVCNIFVGPYQAFRLRHYEKNWRLVAILMVPMIAFLCVGVEVLVRYDSPWLKRGMGLLFFLIACHRCWVRRGHEREGDDKKYESATSSNSNSHNDNDSGDSGTGRTRSSSRGGTEMTAMVAPISTTGALPSTRHAPRECVSELREIEIVKADHVEHHSLANEADVSSKMPPPSSIAAEGSPLTKRDSSSKAYVISAAIAGGSSGFLRGLIGAGGPPLMVFVEVWRLQKDEARVAITYTILLMEPVRAFLLLYVKEQFDASDTYIYFLLGFVALCAIEFGNRVVSNRVNEDIFARIILSLLVAGGALMMTADTNASKYVAIALPSCAAIYFASTVCASSVFQRHAQKKEDEAYSPVLHGDDADRASCPQSAARDTKGPSFA
eukprot:g1888.t1